jgi:MFS family permease
MSDKGAALSDSGSQDPAAKRDQRGLKHTLLGLAGASIEWYDFLLYATAAAVVFPTVFFPARLSPFVALIASFATFSTGYFARPVGAMLFGVVGDRLGRKMAFAVALITMGTATTLIGCLPTYATAGYFAPLALVSLRVVQGFALGGQWGGAVLLATESAPKGKRGLYGSVPQVGLPLGVLLANLALFTANGLTSEQQFLSYGWRIPFLMSIVLIGFGLFIHYRVADTATDRELRQARRSSPDQAGASAGPDAPAGTTRARPESRLPAFQALRLHPKLILLTAGANLGSGLTFYILITYVVAYGANAAGLQLPRSTMLAATLIGQIVAIPCIIFAGGLSDHLGRWRTYMLGTALSGIWTFVFFRMIETRSFLWITFAVSVGMAFVSLSYGPMAALYAELFNTRIRYSSVSIVYQLSAIVGGGMGPIIATAAYERYRSNFWVAAFVSGFCAFSLVCASTLYKRPPDPTLE